MERAELMKPVGERDPITGFAAGALVHTKQGMVPIEDIRIGDWVLSKHEDGSGEVECRRVVRTIRSREEVPICFVKYYRKVESAVEFEGVFATPDHPFFVQDVGWRAANEAADYGRFIAFDGSTIEGYDCYTLWATPEVDVAYGQGTVFDSGPLVNFSSGYGQVSQGSYADDVMGGMSELWRRTVFNIEVEEFHTYFVGKMGVWVHDFRG